MQLLLTLKLLHLQQLLLLLLCSGSVMRLLLSQMRRCGRCGGRALVLLKQLLLL